MAQMPQSNGVRSHIRWIALGTSSALILGSTALMAGSVAAQSSQTEAEDDVAAAETTTDSEDSPRFACQMVNGQHTVMYMPESQPGEAYAWATPTELGGGWTEERRCGEIARRLEEYRPDGLVELQNSVENGYDIVCVTSEDNPACRIVFTVPPGQDPVQTRDRVFDNIASANSGEVTQSVYTFQDANQGGDILNQIGEALDINLPGMGSLGNTSGYSGDGIYLKPFLDASDRGTGEFLQEGRSSGGRQLNPDSFR